MSAHREHWRHRRKTGRMQRPSTNAHKCLPGPGSTTKSSCVVNTKAGRHGFAMNRPRYAYPYPPPRPNPQRPRGTRPEGAKQEPDITETYGPKQQELHSIGVNNVLTLVGTSVGFDSDCSAEDGSHHFVDARKVNASHPNWKCSHPIRSDATACTEHRVKNQGNETWETLQWQQNPCCRRSRTQQDPKANLRTPQEAAVECCALGPHSNRHSCRDIKPRQGDYFGRPPQGNAAKIDSSGTKQT